MRDKVNSWICYKYIQNTGYQAYLPPSYSQLSYLILNTSNFYGNKENNSDKYGTVNLTLNMVAKDSPAPAPTPTPTPAEPPTIHNYGEWNSSNGYSVVWSPSEIYPVVQHNGQDWIACSDTQPNQEPGNQSNGWNAWEVYTKHNCQRDFN